MGKLKWYDKLFYWTLAAAALYALVSCSTPRQTSVEYVTKEHIQYIDAVKHDSIHVHDSIYISAVSDTILIEKWHTAYIERVVNKDSIVWRNDTTYIERVQAVEIVKKGYISVRWLWLLLAGALLFIKKSWWSVTWKYIKRLFTT